MNSNDKIQNLNHGTILVITLWVLTLLSTIALSVTYRMRIELKLAGNELSRDKIFLTAKAGVIQALDVLNQDTNDEYDILSEAWSNYSTELYGINLFKDIAVGEGKFNVSYVYEKDVFTGTQDMFYGMQDEESKININEAAQDVLESLFGTPEIATSIRAWRGDTEVASDILLNEGVYYEGLPKPYKRKGEPLECLEELTMVRGITAESLFGKDMDGDGVIDVNEQGVVKYLTIYGDGLININTAGVTVLRAIGFTEDLSYKIMRYRLGYDELLGTGDDGIFTDVTTIAEKINGFEALAPGEDELINSKQALLKVTSRYYTAYIEASGDTAKARIRAVLDKKSPEGSQIVRWDEE